MPSDDRPASADGPAQDRRSNDPAADDLANLDPNDPDVQALKTHLARMQTTSAAFTVEGTVERIGDYASSASRVRGPVRIIAIVMVAFVFIWLLFVGFQSLLF